MLRAKAIGRLKRCSKSVSASGTWSACSTYRFRPGQRWSFRAGFTAKDDNLPPRLLKEAAASGPAKGLVSGLDKMLPEYYQVRGWTADGIPTSETLSRLSV